MSEPNAVPTSTTNNAPKGTAPQPAPKYSLTANSPRELMLKAAQIIFKSNLFENRMTKGGKDGTGDKVPYFLWNLDDSGKIANFNDGITLTPEEAKMFPSAAGLPTVFSGAFTLRQIVAPALVVAKINERQLATATRETNKVTSVSDDALLAEINRRRVAEGKQPIE